jgi:hypothetical protein
LSALNSRYTAPALAFYLKHYIFPFSLLLFKIHLLQKKSKKSKKKKEKERKEKENSIPIGGKV